MKLFLKFVACVLVASLGFACGFVGNGYLSQPETEKFIDGKISFHFIHLGNRCSGDSIFIQCGEDDILIDAGSTQESSTTIIEYVDQFVTDGKLEYVIATHAHEDHISAFYSTQSREGIFAHYDTDLIIDFPNTNKTNPTDASVLGKYIKSRDEEVKNGAKHYTALQCYNNTDGAQRVYELSGGVKMEILYNYYYENTSSGENNYSVCLLFSQGDNHYLFTGDLEKSGEEKLVEFYDQTSTPLPKCKLYKAGHHGSKTSSCDTLLSKIQPEIVVVCCVAGSGEYTDGENTFPTQIFINNIAPYTDKVYVTSLDDSSDKGSILNGNIVLTYDGETPKKTFSGSDKVLKDSDWFKNNRTCPNEWL